MNEIFTEFIKKVRKNGVNLKLNKIERLHRYFKKLPLCKATGNSENDLENLINWVISQDHMNDYMHECIYELNKMIYYTKKHAEEQKKQIQEQMQSIPIPIQMNVQNQVIINYEPILDILTGILNLVAPEDTELTIYNGYYQFREFGISNNFGPPLLIKEKI